MYKTLLSVLLMTSIAIAISPAIADEVRLKGGSVIKGDIITATSERLTIETEFAGKLDILMSSVVGLMTDNESIVKFDSGDRISGQLTIGPDGTQQITSGMFGTVVLEVAQIDSLWSAAGGQSASAVEQQIAGEQATKRIQELEESVEALREAQPTAEDLWSAKVGLDLLSATGNTERFGVQGRAHAKRVTEFDRLSLYLETDFQEQDNIETADEIILGASLERDFSERTFAFGEMDIERDDFENVDLRATLAGGVGRFLIKNPGTELKASAGVGYEFASFTDGTTKEEPVVRLGYDFLFSPFDFLTVVHTLTYLPSIESPSEDYRLIGTIGTGTPLGKDSAWSLEFNIRSQYDSQPIVGIEELDTSYNINLVYAWD